MLPDTAGFANDSIIEEGTKTHPHYFQYINSANYTEEKVLLGSNISPDSKITPNATPPP